MLYVDCSMIRRISEEDRGKKGIYLFLARFARPESSREYLDRLIEAAAGFESDNPTWKGVTSEAEVQGMAPLLYSYTKKAEISPPSHVRRELQGLFLRHRNANRIRSSVLKDVLSGFAASGIPVLVLKGGALCHLLYADPALRPMSDLDLLIPLCHMGEAHAVLKDLGFSTPGKGFFSPNVLCRKHPPPSITDREGFRVQVELHHRLFMKNEFFETGFTDVDMSSIPFVLKPDGFRARTLGYEEMLCHLCLHLCSMYHAESPTSMTRLIWVADVIGWAEKYMDKIDWQKIQKECPNVPAVLSLLHHLTPLNQALVSRIHSVTPKMPKGIGAGFPGLPETFPREDLGGLGHLIYKIIFPSEWWLRLHYGLPMDRSVFWRRWLLHPLNMMRIAFLRLMRIVSRSSLRG